MKYSSIALVTLLSLCDAFQLGTQRLVPPEVELDEAHVRMMSNAGNKRPFSSIAVASVPTLGNFTFTQKLDHSGKEAGSFEQRIWYNSEFWAGPGSPIIFFTPGEIAADRYGGYLTNVTLTGKLAQEMKGAVVMVEHRFWGGSSPYQDLTTKNLQQLTLKNSIADFVKIAAEVKLPFDVTGTGSNANNAPWIFSGGSYSGSMAAWTESTSPGTFWAYHASSAPVEAISDYWQYFSPIQQGMPKNCSRDLSNVINYIDRTLATGSKREQYELKQKFGLGALQNDDFGQVIEYGPWEWQSNTFTTGYSQFFQFCDAIEGVGAYADQVSTTAGGNKPVKGGKPGSAPGHGKPGKPGKPEAGTDLQTSLNGYAKWVKEAVIPGFCQGFGYSDENSLECFDTHNKNNLIFTDRTVYNAFDRQWQWMLCNEPFGWWQDGAPQGTQSIVSRQIKPSYWTRQCELLFPREGAYTYGLKLGKTEAQFNAYTKGWQTRPSKRLLYVNGQFDPWKTAGVSSEYRPGGPLRSTPEVPVLVIPGGFHCSDLRLSNAAVNEGVAAVVDSAVDILKKWAREFYIDKGQKAKF